MTRVRSIANLTGNDNRDPNDDPFRARAASATVTGGPIAQQSDSMMSLSGRMRFICYRIDSKSRSAKRRLDTFSIAPVPLIPKRQRYSPPLNGSIESKKSAEWWNVINHKNRERTNSPQRQKS
jgi:hypothetical protein